MLLCHSEQVLSMWLDFVISFMPTWQPYLDSCTLLRHDYKRYYHCITSTIFQLNETHDQCFSSLKFFFSMTTYQSEISNDKIDATGVLISWFLWLQGEEGINELSLFS